MRSIAVPNLTLSCLLAALPAFGAAEETLAPPLPWRVAVREPWVLEAPAAPAAAGSAAGLLLHDRQIRLTAEGDDRYEHTLLRVPAAQIFEHSVRIDVTVDPRYQDLVIHALRLTHGAAVATTFTAAQIHAQLRTQASEAEAHKRDLDPRQQVSLQVPDVAPGDLLECEYTVHSHAARFAGLFKGHYAAQWPSGADVPVHLERLRVIWPAQRALQYRIVGGSTDTAPRIDSHPGELDVQWQDLRPPAAETQVPRWFERRSTVLLSDFADWQQVAALLAPQYARPDPAAPEPLDQPTTQPTVALIRNAVRLVHSKVQPLSGVGAGPYLPADPAVVLQRGYGDSHDIARLLVTLLRRVGVDAQVALADSRGALLDNRLPSPFILDAALLVARSGTTEYWLNPIAPASAEALGVTDPAELRRALLVAATGGRIVTLPRPPPDSRLRTVTQQFDLSAGDGHPAALTVTTQFRGAWAQAVRADLLALSPAQLQLNQAQAVAQDYPEATVDGSVVLQDLPQQQAVQISQRFSLPHAFGQAGKPGFSFFAEAFVDAVGPRDEATRKFPLSLPWPLALREDIEAVLPPDFEVPSGRIVIENPAFRYERVVNFAHGTVHIDHRYVALSDHVDPAQYPQFLTANAQVYQALGLRVQREGISWRTWLQRHTLTLFGAGALLAVGAAGWRRWRTV